MNQKITHVFCLQDNVSAEVSFHMARPATVLSNASGHSLASAAESGDKKLSSRSSVSPSNVMTVSTNERATRRAPDQSEASMSSEWTSLVDTATKAILDTEPGHVAEEENIVNNNNTTGDTGDNVTDTQGQGHPEVSDLHHRVTALEAELRTERRGRADLEAEVRSFFIIFHSIIIFILTIMITFIITG